MSPTSMLKTVMTSTPNRLKGSSVVSRWHTSTRLPRPAPHPSQVSESVSGSVSESVPESVSESLSEPVTESLSESGFGSLSESLIATA